MLPGRVARGRARVRDGLPGGDGPGYTCFGGTLPDELGRREDRAAYEARYPDGLRELSRASAWLAHWAPGMDGHVFPEGTGIYMEPGDGLVIQMHYYGSAAPGERDAGVSLGRRPTWSILGGPRKLRGQWILGRWRRMTSRLFGKTASSGSR